jgi:predicted nucleotidyltransferase component of viral defense system
MSQHNKDIIASIYGRLTNEARKQGRQYAEVLQYYGMERFLDRLSKTQYADDFILKGGLVFYGWEIPMRRPTKDIDFLGFTDNHTEIIHKVIAEAIAVSVPDDGVNFDIDSLSIEETQVDADRRGIRAKFMGYLGRSEIRMQIDFGFSDEITSEATIISYPTLLKDMKPPLIKSYPVESVVAEKFHAMERYVETPSRWKDYYDVWLISEHFKLDSLSLQRAIERTFEVRNTPVPTGRPSSIAPELANQYDNSWKAFLKKNGLENGHTNEFPLFLNTLWEFLEFPLNGLKTKKSTESNRNWSPSKRKWI